MNNETFEQMALRVAEEADDYADAALQCVGEFHPDWHEVRDVRFATRIKEELCKGQEPTHWWNPKHPTLTIQLTKPHGGGGWEPAYSHPAPILADMVLVPREPTKEMISAGLKSYHNPKETMPDIYKAMIATYEKEQKDGN